MKDKNIKLVVIALVVIFLVLFSCVGCSVLSYFIFGATQKDFETLYDNTKEVENYTLTFDFYARGESEYRDEEFWFDIKGEQTVDGNTWYASMELDSHDYQSWTEFAKPDGDIYGKIDYEDDELSQDWTLVESFYYDDYYYDSYYYGFQRNEDEVISNITDYDSFLKRLVKNSEEKVSNWNIFEGKYYVSITDQEAVASLFVDQLISKSYHYVCNDDITVGDMWATVAVKRGVITEIKIYFTDVEVDDCGDDFVIEEGGITLTLSEIDNTTVDIPKEIN